MKLRSVAGLFLLLLVVGVVVAGQLSGCFSFLNRPTTAETVPTPAPGEPLVVTGFVGGEKIGFLEDPAVVAALRDRYGLRFEAVKAGSIEMVSELSPEGKDVLWPSSQVAAELHRRRGGKALAQETVFNSPLVLFSWDVVADALAKEGLMHQRAGVWYADDFSGLVRRLLAGTEWRAVGLPQLYGRMRIFCTDPKRSNSGNMFAGLLASILSGGDLVTEQELPSVLPQLSAYFARMGYMEHSSGDIFESFLKTGVGARPIVVGYESQMVEYAIAHRDQLQLLQQRIRIVYPTPTVWSEHPAIALTDNGRRLVEALKDTEIQRLAWSQHGFRSGLMGVDNDPQALPIAGIPATIEAVVPMPSAAVMERIIAALGENPVLTSTPEVATVRR